MKKPSLSVVKNEAGSSADIYLYGIIGDYWTDDPLTARSFLRELTSLELSFQVINVHINSPGGDIWEGLAMCNAIRASKREIHTWNDGIAASMASVILASATDGRRHAAKGSLTMIHNASTICWGNSDDMAQTAELLEKHDDVLATILADATSLTIDEVKAKWFDYRDHYLTAEEAAEVGLVVIETYQAEERPANVQNMPLQKVAAIFNEKIAITNHDNMFGQKFKNLASLAKVAAAAITADQVKAVNDEIEAAEINGITAVLDSELEVANKAVTENGSLKNQISAKDTEIQNLKNQITAHEATIAEQKTKLDAAAEDPSTPPKKEGDKTPGEGKQTVDDFSTSVDAEFKALYGN